MATSSHHEDYEDYKEYELQANKQLSENLKLLVTKYESRVELMSALAQDFCLGTDKKPFHEIVYYLSNLEYMIKVEGMFINWPPSNVQKELLFCRKIIQHVINLNNTYKDANIPILTMSQLFAPAGVKVLKFLLKWSELCMLEHLRTLPNIFPFVLHPIKPNEDLVKTEIMLKAIHMQTVGICIKSRSGVNYSRKLGDFKEPKKMMLKKMKEKFLIARSKLLVEDHDLLTSALVQTINPSLLQMITENSKEYSDVFQSISQKFAEIEEINSKNKNLVLVHNKNDFKVPEDIQHIVKNEDILNLRKYFVGLRKFLENRIEDIPKSSNEYFQQTMTRANELIEKYSDINQQLQDKIDTFKSLLEKFSTEEEIKALIDKLESL